MLRGWIACVTVPTSAHRGRYIRCFGPVGALLLLGKSLLLARIANSSSNLTASQAGRRRFESGRPLLEVPKFQPVLLAGIPSDPGDLFFGSAGGARRARDSSRSASP